MNNYLMASKLLLAVLIPVAASAAETTTQALVTDAQSRVPDLRYESAFTGYVPYREQKIGEWKELNDAVRAAGGHIGIVGGSHSQHTAKPAAAPSRQETKR